MGKGTGPRPRAIHGAWSFSFPFLHFLGGELINVLFFHSQSRGWTPTPIIQVTSLAPRAPYESDAWGRAARLSV